MEEVKDFRMRAYISDKPFTLTICSQKPTEFTSKDISKIYLYNADFYKKVVSTIVRMIVDQYCGRPAEPEFMEHNITADEKLVVEVSNCKYVSPHNANFDVDVTLCVSHEYNNGSEILANINIKSLYRCGRDIVEIASKLRASSRSDIWLDEEDE